MKDFGPHQNRKLPPSLGEPATAEDELAESQRLIEKLKREVADLRETNRSLSDSEQRLRLAIATGQIGLWVWNSTDVTNAGDWSPRLKAIFGLPLDMEVTHEIFLECVHPEDRERVNAGVMGALTGADGGEYRCEYRIRRREDRSEHWVTARGQAFFDVQGTPVRFIGTLMDITERKLGEQSIARVNVELERRVAERTDELARSNQALYAEVEERKRAETALQRREDDLRIAIDTIPGLVWASLPDGHVEYLNKRWLDYTGLRHEEAVGWEWQAAIHPDDLAGLLVYWRSILAAGEAGQYEARMRRFDGEFRWFLFRWVPLQDEAGNVVRWYGTNTDIEATRASEQLARGQLDALTRMLEMLADESDPDQLPRHVVNTIQTQLGAFSITIWERNEDRLDLLGVTEEGRFLTRSEAGDFEGSIPVTGAAPPLWVDALQSESHILIEDINKEPTRILLGDGRTAIWRQGDLTPPFANLKAHLSAQGVCALLICPLLLARQLAGIIGIRFKGTRLFGRDEIELTKALAHQAMLSIQLMRLAQQSRRAAVVAERNRMARDMHDTLAQGFTGIIVQLEAAADARSKGVVVEADEHLNRAGHLARESLKEARRSVRALRPRALEEKDLSDALDALIRSMTAGTTIRTKFTVQGAPGKLPPTWEENLLRIVQEVLTNVLRHSRARLFKVKVIFEPDEVRFDMRDNGCGFDPTSGSDGFGLLGIRERTEAMGGRISIQSVKSKGTTILITLPLAKGISPA